MVKRRYHVQQYYLGAIWEYILQCLELLIDSIPSPLHNVISSGTLDADKLDATNQQMCNACL
jgi:hypothetical protein